MTNPTTPAKRRALSASLLGLILLVILFVGLLVWIYGGRGAVVATFQQPSTVTYDDAAYVAEIQTAGNDPFTIGDDGHYQLFIGRSNSYGHRTNISVFGADGQRAKDAIATATPAWTAAGFRLTFADGHEYFVPAEAFTGGR